MTPKARLCAEEAGQQVVLVAHPRHVMAEPNTYRNSSVNMIGWIVTSARRSGTRGIMRRLRPTRSSVSRGSADDPADAGARGIGASRGACDRSRVRADRLMRGLRSVGRRRRRGRQLAGEGEEGVVEAWGGAGPPRRRPRRWRARRRRRGRGRRPRRARGSTAAAARRDASRRTARRGRRRAPRSPAASTATTSTRCSPICALSSLGVPAGDGAAVVDEDDVVGERRRPPRGTAW